MSPIMDATIKVNVEFLYLNIIQYACIYPKKAYHVRPLDGPISYANKAFRPATIMTVQ